jgi:large subunit ribosomal protein L29
MKPHEVRGLPVDEIKGMLSEAENNLFQLRFQHAVGQLDNKLQLKQTRREIAILRTLLKDEADKAELAKAGIILNDLSKKFGIKEIAQLLRGEKVNFDKAKLRRAVRDLYGHPRRKEFAVEFKTLKNIATK